MGIHITYLWSFSNTQMFRMYSVFLGGAVVKNRLPMQETWIQPPG